MRTMTFTRLGSRRLTALLLALTIALAATPAFATPRGDETVDFVTMPHRALTFQWIFLDLLVDLFFGPPEAPQSLYGRIASIGDPDGQSLRSLESTRIEQVAPSERGPSR